MTVDRWSVGGWSKRIVLLLVLIPVNLHGSAGSDFNGNGRDDIATFIRSSQTGTGAGDVWVSLSTGSAFGSSSTWSTYFCLGLEIPATGDFDGDGRDDLATFKRDVTTGAGRGDVYVALSTGSSFGAGTKWHEYFCIGNEIPAVGDFNGDGRDDIATFLRSSAGGGAVGDVYVALSNGSSFGTGTKWNDYFSIGNEIPAVGDFNGDGRDDIATFLRDTATGTGAGDVYVALSNGSSFGTGIKWHDYFCIGNQIPGVGDFDGDGRDDIVTFLRGTSSSASTGDVYVALSNGSAFGAGIKWNNWFCIGNEIPMVGDFSGDGKADIATFVHETSSGTLRGDVFVAASGGTKFGTGIKWHDHFCVGDEVPTTLAAAFPQYLYANSAEDSDAEHVGYASSEADRFWDNVCDFKKEFQNTWPCTQYYWGERCFLEEDHLTFVDSADLAFISGHGSSSHITMDTGEGTDLTKCSWGSWSSNSRKGDLEYIAFESCQVLSLDGDWRGRWSCTPNRRRPFAGLHVACGFKNDHQESPVFELSDEFAENLEDGYSVRWAWLEATDDEDDWVWGHDNIGCVIYVSPYENETISGHTSSDRWYHHSDYSLAAEYWNY